MNSLTKKFLDDILDCKGAIESFTDGVQNFYEFSNNRLIKSGVEREMLIISEALSRIFEIDPQLIITDAKLIRGMRNRIVHAYDSVDDAIVWNAVKKHLPILKTEVEQILNED